MATTLEEPLLGNENDDGNGNGKKAAVSKNVYVIFAIVSLSGLSESIWCGAVLAAWLFLLSGGDPSSNPNFLIFSSAFFFLKQRRRLPNTTVGGVEALQGLASLLTALPIGYLADTKGKSLMCKIGGVGYIFCTLLTLVTVTLEWSTRTETILFAVCLTLWGVFGGIFSGPMQALFADSVPEGERSFYYTLLQNCYIVPSLVGPLLSIALFQRYGDHWTFEELKFPFVIGLLLEFPPALCAFLLSDEYSLKEDDEVDLNDDDLKDDDGNKVKKKKKEQYTLPLVNITLTRRSIPFVLFLSDLCYSLGSGMTIKFIPLFFAKEVGLSPSGVQVIGIGVCVLLMIVTMAAQRLSKTLGRVQVVIMCRMSGIICLVILSQLISHGHRAWHIIVPVYLVRASLMNSAYPIDESILMDNVPKNERSRWKSLESVSTAGWCGSAFVGGILADKYSYDFSFLMTAILQFCGTLTYMLLIPLVLDEKPAIREEEEKNQVEEELLNPMQQQQSGSEAA